MTNLTKLIERRQGENESLINELRIVSNMINVGEKIQWGQDTTLMDKAADALESSQSITEAYRQALLDVDEKLEEQIEHALKMSNWQAQSALETIRAQIEGLLSKIDKV
jgi:hypothetical protein